MYICKKKKFLHLIIINYAVWKERERRKDRNKSEDMVDGLRAMHCRVVTSYHESSPSSVTRS